MWQFQPSNQCYGEVRASKQGPGLPSPSLLYFMLSGLLSSFNHVSNKDQGSPERGRERQRNGDDRQTERESQGYEAVLKELHLDWLRHRRKMACDSLLSN